MSIHVHVMDDEAIERWETRRLCKNDIKRVEQIGTLRPIDDSGALIHGLKIVGLGGFLLSKPKVILQPGFESLL
jgi:hypothetical protein